MFPWVQSTIKPKEITSISLIFLFVRNLKIKFLLYLGYWKLNTFLQFIPKFSRTETQICPTLQLVIRLCRLCIKICFTVLFCLFCLFVCLFALGGFFEQCNVFQPHPPLLTFSVASVKSSAVIKNVQCIPGFPETKAYQLEIYSTQCVLFLRVVISSIQLP